MDESQVSVINIRLQRVLEEISEAAIRSGRDPRDVCLVVVTKSQPLSVVRSALEAGAGILGENYAEEAVGKIAALNKKSEVEWHMIGHVQSRKADLVARYFNMLHSLDSLKLAVRLDRFCAAVSVRLPVLLEVNLSGETTKYGFPARQENDWPELLPVFDQILQSSHLDVRGLMTMPPFSVDPERSRPYFRQLRRLLDFLSARLPHADWRDLSMGTSADFVPAVEEGATYLRIGQAILGARST